LSNDHLTYLTLPNDFLESSHFLSTGWKSGTLFSSRKPVTSAAKRWAILQNSQADVVDMEAFAYADFCQRHKIPFACLKVITDRADAEVAENFNANLAESAQLLAENALILIDFIQNKFDIKAENG
jgi:nucleoside phosphorylase